MVWWLEVRRVVFRSTRAEVVEFFRGQDPCLLGMEACATAHHWARELIVLGHEVRLMPPAYVKAYVKRNKNDAADAAARSEERRVGKEGRSRGSPDH